MLLEKAKRALADGGCTLVVAKRAGMPADGASVRKFYRRGVADLACLLQDEPEFLRGASVADKIIGKAAAALMIKGGVAEVFSRVITRQALSMFEAAAVPVEYCVLVEFVENRTKTGRCPLDTICAPLGSVDEMADAIYAFLKDKNIIDKQTISKR